MDQNELTRLDQIGNDLFGTQSNSLIHAVDDERQASAIYVARDTTPENAVQSLRLSQQLGVHSEFVERNKQYLQREVTAKKLNDQLFEARETHPKTAEFLLDPTNLSISQNEIDSLKSLEDSIKNYGVLSKSYSSLSTGLAQMYSSMAKIPGGLYAIAALPQNIIASQFPESGLTEVTPPDWLMNNPLAQHYDKRSIEWSSLNPDAQRSVTNEFAQGNYANAGKALAYQVIQNAPTTIALLASNWAGLGEAGLTAMGLSSGSQHMGELLEKGTNPTKATISGIGSGIYETAFESLELKALKGWEHALEKELGRELLKSEKKEVYKSLAKTLAATVAVEGSSEAATEFSTRLTDYLAGASDFNVKETLTATLDAGLIGLGSAFATSVPSTTLVSNHRIGEINRARANQELFLDLTSKTESNKLREHSPEKYKELLDNLTAGTPIENVSFSKDAFDALFQEKGENPANVASELGILKEYAEAEKTGTDISLKTSDAISKFSNADIAPELSRHMKFGSDPNTMAELQQDQADLKETLERLDNDAKESNIPTFEKQIQNVRKELQSQLAEAGMPTKEALRNAQIAAETIRTDSLNMEVQPQELWEKYKFQVTNQGLKKGNDFYYQDGVRKKLSDLKLQTQHKFSKEITMPSFRTSDFVQTEIDPMGKLDIAGKQVVNNHTGWSIRLSKKLSHINTFAEKVAVQNIDSLVKNAQLLYTVQDNEHATRATHVFYSPMQVDGQDFIVRFTGKEAKGQFEVDRFFVDQLAMQVPKKTSGDASIATGLLEKLPLTEGRTNKISLNQFGEMIKAIRQLSPYFQSSSQDNTVFQESDEKRGAFDPKTFFIHLFSAKDKSTFLHELGHARLFLLNKYVSDGLATERMKADFQAALEYVGANSFDEMTTEQHETFAKSLEAYFMEGKAPSKRLQSLFADIKAWFLHTYASFFGASQSQPELIKQALGVELNPEIREVFDRMFVSENEIAKNQPKPMFTAPALLGVLSEAETHEYLNAAEWARIEAESDLQSKLMKDVIRKSKADYKEQYDKLYSEAKTRALEMQAFKTIEAIKTNYKLDVNQLENQYSEFADSLPKGLTTSSDGAFDASLVASLMGYQNAQDMLTDLSKYKRGLDHFLETEVQAQMSELHPELLKSPELSREAIKSAYNDNIAKMKRKELEILATKDFPTLKKVSEKLIARLPRMGDVVAQAKTIIEQKTSDELKPYKYQQAEKRFAKEAAKNFVAGDIEGAFEAKKMEYLNFELYRESLRAQDQLQKELRFFKKLFKPDEDLAKSRDTDIVNAARAVLAEFGISKSEKSADDWLSKMKAYDKGRYNSLSVLIKAATNEANQIDQLPLGKVFALGHAVHALWELSKIENEYHANEKQLVFSDVENQIVDHLNKLGTASESSVDRKATNIDKLHLALLGVKGSLTRLEPYFKAMGGPMYDLVFKKIIDAQTQMQTRYSNLITEFTQTFEPIRDTLKSNQKIYSKELNYEFAGLQEILGALLHRGNDSNFAKLIVGNQWGEINDRGEIDSHKWDAFESRLIREGVLKKEHYQFLQNTWDLLEKSKADSQKSHKKMFGYYFEEITAKEFTNEFGTFRGGYFPAVADPYKVTKANQFQEAEAILNVNNSFMFPSSNKGFTKERAANYFAPLIMDLNQVPNHLKKVTTFIDIGPEVSQAARLFFSPKVQDAYRSFDRGAIPEMIVPWLQRVAQQRLPVTGTGQGWRFMDNVATYLRSSTGLQTMAFNFINAMQNFTQLPAVLTRAKARSMRDALGAFITNPKGISEMMYDKSEFMRNRKGSLVMEAYDTLNDLLENPSHAQDGTNFIRKNARFMSEFTQGMVESIAWLSGYKDALANGQTETQAIANGDQLVRLTQGGFTMAEMSRFESGSPVMRLFTIFYSFFNAVLNNNVGRAVEIQREMGLKKGASHLFYLYLLGFMLPAILNDGLGLVLSGGDFDEDYDGSWADEFLKLFFGSQFNLGLAMLPFGQVARSTVNAFNSKPYDDKISLSPAVGVIERSMQAPASLYKAIEGEGSSKKAVTDVLTLIGMLTKTPTAPLAKPINYIFDVKAGNAKPTGPVDFTRGLLTGKSGHQ